MSNGPLKVSESEKEPVGSSLSSQPLCEKLIFKRIQSRSDFLESLEVLSSVDSTNSYLMQQDATIGKARVCLAEAQLAGRGRRGNEWMSVPYKNIMFSLSWGFQKWPETLTGLGLAVALIVAERLNKDFRLEVGIKWPNDLLINNEKLAGVLVEVTGNVNDICRVVIGLGLNVHQPNLPGMSDLEEQDYAWTDLKSQGVIVDRNRLAASIIGDLLDMIREFEQVGFSKYVQRWNDLSCHTNKNVTLREPGSEISIAGRMLGVNDVGALLISSNNGEQQVISNSNLSLRLAR